MKYYAVKKGRKTGVFKTWEECREQVSGYSGAEYKSFAVLEEAQGFVNGGQTVNSTDAPSAYVDGSYNINTGVFSFGAVILGLGEIKTYSESFDDPALATMRNVAGEIKGAEFVMRLCEEQGIEKINIYYDYEGIAAWAKGVWKTNKDGTKAYKAYYDSIKDRVLVNFIKVKGHSGDKYNDMADKLAKEAAGVPI